MSEVDQMRAVTVEAQYETNNPDLPETLIGKVGNEGNVSYNHPEGTVTIRLTDHGEGKATEQARRQLDRLADIAQDLEGPYALYITVEELIAYAGGWRRPGEQIFVPPDLG